MLKKKEKTLNFNTNNSKSNGYLIEKGTGTEENGTNREDFG